MNAPIGWQLSGIETHIKRKVWIHIYQWRDVMKALSHWVYTELERKEMKAEHTKWKKLDVKIYSWLFPKDKNTSLQGNEPQSLDCFPSHLPLTYMSLNKIYKLFSSSSKGGSDNLFSYLKFEIVRCLEKIEIYGKMLLQDSTISSK